MSSYDDGRIQLLARVPAEFHAAMERAGYVRDPEPGWSVRSGHNVMATAADEDGARAVQEAFRAAGLQGPTRIEENKR